MASKKTRYMKTGKADISLRFSGKTLKLTISIPSEMGSIMVKRLGKRVNKSKKS